MPDREKVINKVTAIVADMQEEVDEWKDYSDSELRGGLTCDCDWWYKTLQTLKDAIALLKAQEPRLMTEQEMRDAEPGAVIYCEQRDEVRTYLTPLIKYDDGVFENRFLGAEPEATQLPNVRFWTSRPTDEQREATPWEP